MSKNSSSSGGVGFTGLLAIVFIVLKLTGVITWSWWWVLSPIWIIGGIILFITLTVISVAAVAQVRDERKRR